MYFLETGGAQQAAATSMLELGQRAITRHFAFLQQATELSQKLFARSLEVKNGSDLVRFTQDYLAGVHKLASEVVCAQVTLTGEVMRAGCQSFVRPETVPAPAPAPALDKVEKVVAGGDITEAQERGHEEVAIAKATMETTVAPTKARRKSRPKKA
ncbi:hypothetical protein GCT13_43755 [Paraburkholderia sp. CNPSo 3157]|uniref:Phasin domain-containing protein n=1 Tax=Paraburkholderia franconis TaxID=2654983 RepID=A0A7X1TLH7_9BURK|nr:hypothetical protein [Paraburkholderia franconis]MPW23474.1 hypothetical protein [Paraburkholderia franconis]